MTTSIPDATLATLNWPQRLQIAKTFQLPAKTAARAFGVAVKEYREIADTTPTDTQFDANPYASHFTSNVKRGRPSSKLADAFTAVTTTPVPLDQFCNTHQVSSHCMKQRKRFDRENVHGDIVVRKHEGELHIWREQPETV